MLHNSKTQEGKIIIELFLEHLKKEHKFSKEKIEEEIKKINNLKQETSIPLSIFSNNLSALETIIKYLVENKNMKKSRIAEETNRSINTIWTTYKKACEKESKKIKTKTEESESFPMSILKNRKFSTLEIIVLYLRENLGLNFKEIASSLKRKEITIRTVYKRSQDKKKQKK